MIRADSTWNKNGAPAGSAWNVGGSRRGSESGQPAGDLPEMVSRGDDPWRTPYSRHSSRRREVATAVIKHIDQGLLHAVSRFPTGCRAKLARVGNQRAADRRGASARVDPDFDRLARQSDEVIQGVGELRSSTRPKVIDLAWFSVLGQEAIAADHVANVGEVTNDLEIANLDIGFTPGLHLGDLVRKCRQDVGRRLAVGRHG